MAYLETSNPNGNYNVVIQLNGTEKKFSTRTKNKEIAEAVVRKIRDLEAAYMNGLTVEECGLDQWATSLCENNPQVYMKLADLSLLPRVNESPIPESSINEQDMSVKCVKKKHAQHARGGRSNESKVIGEVDGVLEIDNQRFSCYFADRDVMIYSIGKTGVYVYVLLTYKTAKQYGICEGLHSSVKGMNVELIGEGETTGWDRYLGRLRFWRRLKCNTDIERKWEMYAPIFTNDCRIMRGMKLAQHALSVSR